MDLSIWKGDITHLRKNRISYGSRAQRYSSGHPLGGEPKKENTPLSFLEGCSMLQSKRKQTGFRKEPTYLQLLSGTGWKSRCFRINRNLQAVFLWSGLTEPTPRNLVCLVCLVYLVGLVSLVKSPKLKQLNKQEKQNKLKKPDKQVYRDEYKKVR